MEATNHVDQICNLIKKIHVDFGDRAASGINESNMFDYLNSKAKEGLISDDKADITETEF